MEAGVSIVIPHYGDPALALHVVECLRAQSTDRELQLIVSDDASPVPFPASPGVELVVSESNGGFGSAANAGAARARLPWLLIVNSDVSFSEDFVSSFVTQAETLPKGIFGPRIIDGSRFTSARIFPAPYQILARELDALGRLRARGLLDRAMGFDVACQPGTIRTTDWLSGVALLVESQDFRAVGGFDTRFHMYSEEVDLQRRLRQAGVIACYIGTVALTHIGGASSNASEARMAMLRSNLEDARVSGGYRRTLAAHAVVVGLNFAHHAIRRLAGIRSAPRQRLKRGLAELRLMAVKEPR